MEREERVLKGKTGTITYTLTYKQVKNINLRINSCGEVFVSANPFVSKEMVDEFVAKKEQWIKKKQSTLTHKPALIEENRIQLLGNSLRIRRICGSHPLVYYSEDTFYVQYEKKEQCDKLIQAYLDQLCDDIFHDIALLTCKRLKAYHISMPQIKLRMMKSQWGNCKPTLGQITLNKRLIHYPVEFIEYVILHEFAHFVHPNHSKAFYELIEAYMPDYKERIALADTVR